MVNCYPRKYHYCFSILFAAWLASCSWIARAGDKDSLHRPQAAIAEKVANALVETRSFPEIDQQLAAQTFAAPSQQLFTESYLQSMYANDTAAHSYQEVARSEFEKMDKDNRYTSSLSPDDLNELPIGLFRKVNNTVVKIAVSNAIFHPEYAELTVYAKLEIPQKSAIFFGVKGLKLSYQGGIIGDAKLVLLGNVPIPINGGTAALTLKGGFSMETGQGQDLTYITMDCNGFKELGIAAEIKFPRSMLVPLKANNERNEDTAAYVKADFNTVVSDWNDILVSVDLPAFEIAPLKGIGFHIGKAVYDGSDVRNSPNIVYPAGYEAQYLPADNPNLWRGLYVSTLEVVLPKQFLKRNQPDSRVSFGANNMIIDNNGLTGSFFANNVLPDGSASGWKFTVDRFNIDLQANHLTGAGFSGMVSLPIAKDPLGYTAVITADNEYLLKLSTLNTLSFDVWQAKCDLKPNSWVQLKLSNGKFEPEAMLHGSLGITASSKPDANGKSVATFKGVQFEDLHLQTKAPYISVSYFGYKNENTVSNFPVTISELSLRTQGDEADLTIGVRINLMEDKFKGETKVTLNGKFQQNEGIQTWKFQKLKLNKISLNAQLSDALSMTGELEIFENDAKYGDAIKGAIIADFMKKKIRVEARAMFGSRTYRYWYVDAKASFGDPGIPVLPPVNIHGFGGGAYYHMKKDGLDAVASPTMVNYVPDSTTALGIKAAVLLNISGRTVVDGELSYEVAFNRNMGINFVGFYGYAKILAEIEGLGDVGDHVSKAFSQLEDAEKGAIAKLGGLGDRLQALKVSNPSQAAENIAGSSFKAGEVGVSAYIGIQYDFTQNIFHATFDAYINAAGGLLTGTATGNRAGWGVLHVAPEEWYFYMGTPTNRMGVKFGLAGIYVKTGAYMMVGDKIPGSPPPPREVADILGIDADELDYMRDLNALGDGRGFAFGSSLTVETGDLNFLILYANFKAGAGFDIMLKNYGDAHCAGSNKKLGFDGWYANGQAYVYLQGELGVKVNLKFIKARFPIISGSAAVLMQAKLPNPTWMKGYMAVRFNILGGLVSGNMRMKIAIGDECEIVTGANSPVDVKIISDLTPAKNAVNVDVFAAPQAAFNMRIGQAFDVEDDDGTKTYRVQLAAFNVFDKQTNQPIPGELRWSSNNDAVTFYSKEVLPPKRTLGAIVKVTFEQLQNGSWQTVYMNGQQSEEQEDVTFTTGTAPDYIPLQNIAYCYPVVDQRNYYPSEYTHGYIVLQRGQSYLFDPRWKYLTQFANNGSASGKQTMQYDSVSQRISFETPILQTQTPYTFDVIAVPPGGNADSDAVVAYAKNDSGEDGSFTVQQNKANSVSRGDVTKSLLSYSFKTSRYNTFRAKINDLHFERSVQERMSSDVINLQAQVGDYELFDGPELIGTAYTGSQPLVAGEAILDDIYYQQDIQPLVYREYPLNNSIQFMKRDTTILGLVPRRAITVMNSYFADGGKGEVSSIVRNRIPYTYNLPYYYKQDYIDLLYQVINAYMGKPELSRYTYLLESAYPFIRDGKYNVDFRYILPGGLQSSSARFEYQNTIR
jgi:hypothetical protein